MLIDFQPQITCDLIYEKLQWKINKFFVLYLDENKGISSREVSEVSSAHVRACKQGNNWE